MIHLYMVRHGETDWNRTGRYLGRTDIALNEAGRQQAAHLAQHLSGRPVDAIYASDLQRALATAAIIGEQVGLKPIPDGRLRELAFGAFEGLTFEEARQKHKNMLDAWLDDPDVPPAGGEAFSAFSARVGAFLDEIKTKHDGQRIMIVAHGGPLREVLRLTLGLPRAGHWYFKLDTASLSELAIYDAGPLLHKLNETGYLKADSHDG